GFGGNDGGEREPCQYLIQRVLELLASHARLELESLDARLGQAHGPVPGFELTDRRLAVHHLVAEEREERRRGVLLQATELLERRVDATITRGMTLGVERHAGQRLRQGAQELDGNAAHATSCPGSVAARTSASADCAARASTAA